MRRVQEVILMVVIFLFSLFSANLVKAAPVGLSGTAYWDMQVAVGSGTGIGDGIIVDDNDTYLPPNPPAGNTLPDSKEYEASDPDGYMYAYASYGVETDWIDVYVNGYALDQSIANIEWFSALSRVAVMSETFTGFNAFSISFDWEFDVDFGGGEGDAKIGFGLVDYTDPTSPSVVYEDIWAYDPLGDTNGTYSWSINTLDPTHVYLFGIGAKAFLEGEEGSEGSVDVYISNINAQATPEPASVLLVGAGLVALGMWVRKRVS